MRRVLRFGPAAVAALEVVLLAGMFLFSDLVDEEGINAIWPVSWLGFLAVGALLTARLPRHRVAWTMFGIGAIAILGQVGDVALAASSATWVPWLAWIGAWLFIPAFALVALFLLWYPTGSVPSPRWRPVQAGIVTLATALAVYYALRPGGTPADPTIDNPLGIAAFSGLRDSAVEGAAGALLAVLVMLAAVSLAFRWRAAEPAVRQQLKWVLLPALWLPLGYLVFGLLVPEGKVGNVGILVFTWCLGINAMAIGVGVAITRYRLYEIDRIINRTVVYAVVAAMLAGTFIGGVALASTVLPTGSSDLGVAVSTLAVAALFNPLRRRVQRAVDRRFDRSRYDARQVAAHVAAGLRNLADPTDVSTTWIDAVAATMRPAVVSVWIKE